MENTTQSFDDERTALERFVVHNPELENLERQIAKFNIFEAVGAVRQELRHSDFLAFLLDPSQNHGLDDRFLKLFLKNVLSRTVVPNPIGPIDIDVAHFGSADVRREWRNIDILVIDESTQFLFAIENKVDSGEGQGQLEGYRSVLEASFPEFKRCYLFLTPDGREGADDVWLPCEYGDIAETISRLCISYGSTIGEDVRTLLAHYESMLRRHIVEDSPIPGLCRAIYREHRKAVDLILEHRPDLQREIADHLIELVKNEKHLMLDTSPKSYIRFAPREWDKHESAKKGKGWTHSNRIVLFEFRNSPDRLTLATVVGPGEEALRSFLHEGALESRVVKGAVKRKTIKWAQVHSVNILSKKDYEKELGELIEKIDTKWNKLLEDDILEVTDLFSKLFRSFEGKSD